MFAPAMGTTKVEQGGNRSNAAMRARILSGLRKGDQARIAEAVGTVPEYVKQVMRYRPNANSALARRIWLAADRILQDRSRLNNEMRG